MIDILRNLGMGGLLAVLLSGASVFPKTPPETASDMTVKGVLIDKECSYNAETRIVPGPRLEGGMMVAYTETRQCALKPECRQSGYGVFTYDTNKFIPFDQAGNRKALEFFKESKKEDDFRVEVTGEMHGDVMKVTSIHLLEQ